MNFVKLIKRSIILSIGVVIFMQLDYYFILFIIYSFLGWLMEITLTLIEKRKFVDRGFLIGPCCPIYGFGALLIMELLENYTDNWLAGFGTLSIIYISHGKEDTDVLRRGCCIVRVQRI